MDTVEIGVTGQRASSWLQGVATGLPVLIGDLGRTHPAQLWVYSNGESAVFQVSITKHADFPTAFLKGFRGAWLSDGASNYNAAASAPGGVRAGCWSHGRRYVFDARNDHVAALEALGIIRDLFMHERTAMMLDHGARLDHRTLHAEPLIRALRAWVDRWRVDDVIVKRPKSAFAKAVNYLDRQWPALVLFLSHPEIEIHNNRSELLVRGPVIGRHNRLVRGFAQRGRRERHLVQLGALVHVRWRRSAGRAVPN